MKKFKSYRYIGKDGIINSRVYLDKLTRINMCYLVASEGKLLTNGEKQVESVTIYEEDLGQWHEIDKPKDVE